MAEIVAESWIIQELSILMRIIMFCIHAVLANSEDPDQTPSSAASDLDLHCLPMSQNATLGLYWLNFGCAENRIQCRPLCSSET